MRNASDAAEALKLPALLSQALTYKAIMYQQISRIEEARYLFAGAVDIAERHNSSEALEEAIATSGSLGAAPALARAQKSAARSPAPSFPDSAGYCFCWSTQARIARE